MFNKHTYRTAMAGAGAPVAPDTKKTESGVLFAKNSESDDFNEFTYSHQPQRKPTKTPNNKKAPSDEKVYEVDLKTVIIGACALALLILLIVVVVIAANSSGKDILRENNSYVSFSKDGSHHIAVNGDVLDESFENEIELIVASDSSFAYVVEKTAEGDLVYILERKKLTPATQSPVSEVLCLADLEPGVVYRDGKNVNFYSKDNDDCITRNNATANNFVIADDASAIAYTISNENNAEESKLFIYADGVQQSYATNMYPVEISKGGKYLYAYGISSDDFVSKKLYLIKTYDDEKIEIEQSFYSLSASNIKGDEIVYTIINPDKGYQTKIYNAKKEKAYKIGGGICVPMLPNNVSKLSTFKSTTFENTFFPEGANASNSATYYVNKKYNSLKLSTYNGKLNSDADVFYYVDLEGVLYSVELGKKKAEAKEIASQVTEFAITEKNNVYFLDKSQYLWFIKTSGGNKKQIETLVTDISFNIYSNVLYFEISDEESIFSTEEGAGKEAVEFARKELDAIPTFLSNGLKRTFVSVMNTESGLYDVYYTSTGKTFKLVEEGCDNIN